MISKRLLILSGIAILAVVINHAAGWGQIAMFNWTNRYRAVTVPNYDQVGSLEYYLISAIRQFGNFTVPAFLFISGYFFGYSSRKEQFSIHWDTVLKKIYYLLIPYFIWTLIIYFSDAISRINHSPIDYLILPLTKGAQEPYFFIPLLCYLSLLSPFIIRAIIKNWKKTLILVCLLQLCILLISYLGLFHIGSPYINQIDNFLPSWLFLRWILFVVLGMILYVRLDDVKRWLETKRTILLILTVEFWVINIIEAEIRFQLLKVELIPYAGINTLSFHLFAIAFIFTFIAYHQISIPFSNILMQLGNKSFSIYLIHFLAIAYTSKLIYHIAPWILGQQWLFLPILILAGLGGPWLLMSFTNRHQGILPIRYSYIFG